MYCCLLIQNPMCNISYYVWFVDGSIRYVYHNSVSYSIRLCERNDIIREYKYRYSEQDREIMERRISKLEEMLDPTCVTDPLHTTSGKFTKNARKNIYKK